MGKCFGPSGVSGRTVYRWYREYRDAEAMRDEDDGIGFFAKPGYTEHEYEWLLHESGIDRKFQKWMRKHLKKLTVSLARDYINKTLLPSIGHDVLAAHGIAAPISRDTAYRWMKKGGAHTMGSGKSYYNDYHENPETIAARRAFDKEMSGPANCSSASPPSAPPRTARRCGLTS